MLFRKFKKILSSTFIYDFDEKNHKHIMKFD